MTAPLLILGWGNPSRGDDALGPMLLAAVRQSLPTALAQQVEVLEDFQLQVEHALDLVGRSRVLLVDASLSAAAPFEVSVLQAAQDSSFTTHALSPQALLQVYQSLQGQAPPPCTLLAIRGAEFELGQPPSPAALSHLAAALHWVRTTWLPTG